MFQVSDIHPSIHVYMHRPTLPACVGSYLLRYRWAKPAARSVKLIGGIRSTFSMGGLLRLCIRMLMIDTYTYVLAHIMMKAASFFWRLAFSAGRLPT